MGDVVDSAADAGREARNSAWFDHAVRFGMVAYGLVHFLIAWLSVQLALGDRGESVSGQGALAELATQPFGRVVVWLVTAGMVLLVLWRLVDLIWGHRHEDGTDLWRDRAEDAVMVGVYGTLAGAAFSVALRGGGSGGGQSEETITARLMAQGWGVWLVGLVGLVIIVSGASLVWLGWTERYREHLEREGQTGELGRTYLLVGKVGYLAKGGAIGLVGALFAWAAATHDPDKSGGLDDALKTLLDQPYGPLAIVAVAIGFACYGVLCLATARHLSR